MNQAAKRWFAGFVAGLYIGFPAVLHAEPGELSQVPLFLGQAVQPNIMMILDDSGSMGWRWLGGSGLSICSNRLAYDPSRRYTPWKGVDSDGNPYTDSNPSAARLYPWDAQGTVFNLLPPSTFRTPNRAWSDADYRRDSDGDWQIRPSSGGWRYLAARLEDRVDEGYDVYQPRLDGGGNPTFSGGRLRLTAPRYFEWNDANGNGRPDRGECSTGGSIAALPLTKNPNDPNPNSQTNYANWFTYYRTRERAMKRAVSEVIWNSRERVGLSGINLRGLRRLSGNGDWSSGGRGVEIANIDDITLDSANNPDPTAASNKKALLKILFRMVSGGRTPLRRALDNAGRYYSGIVQTGHGLFGSSNRSPAVPLLSAAEGGECQQNFTLLFSDGRRNEPFSSSNFSNADGAAGGSYADLVGPTLADVAMYYYQQDFSTLDNRVSTTDLGRGRLDDNPGQHMVTYTIAFGLSGTIDPETQPADATAPFTWTAPAESPSTAQSADDMYHAAWNGRGQYLSAANPDALINSLRQVFRDIQRRSGSAAAAVAVTSTSVQSGGKLFQAGFDSSTWTGTLNAYTIDGSGVGSSSVWQAHNLLDARDLGMDPRVLLSFNGSQGIEFKMPPGYPTLSGNDLAAEQVDDLLADLPSGASSAERSAYLSAIIDYFHGDRSQEGSSGLGFRERQGLLGDIVHSAPVFVGPPLSSLNDPGYLSWAAASDQVNRTPTVYVGSNDGMLHAFDADTGREMFAYLPKLLFSDGSRRGYHWLATQDYDHRYYVDLTITAGDAYFGSDWHTILVGGLRAGGKGIFALDITDPDELADATTGPSKVMWEFAPPDMGFSFAEPTIVQLNNSTNDWAVIIGNGYDNTADGRAKIFVVKLSNGGLIATLDTPASFGSVANGSCADPSSSCNGMSSPVVADINGDGKADRVYAGDVKGNLWVFDITGASPSIWSGTRRRLFHAQTGNGDLSPITARPSVALHPQMRDVATSPNLLVSFSTGQLLAVDDESDNITHGFYTVWDDGASATYTRSDLVEQTITTTTKTVGGVTFDVRLLSNNPVDYSATDKGWFIDYVEDGERGITQPLLFGNLVVWTTVTPKAASVSANKCDSAGESWLMAANFSTGAEPRLVALDVDGDGSFDGNDMVSGSNVAGVHSGNIYWQPSIVSGRHGSGQVLLPVDSSGGGTGGGGASVVTQGIQGISPNGMRSSWGRFGWF